MLVGLAASETLQVAHDPLHLFDANIFYPERYTLAYSDPLIIESAMAAPLLWAGASPVLAYNAILIFGFALTGWITCLVVARWTGSVLAGSQHRPSDAVCPPSA